MKSSFSRPPIILMGMFGSGKSTIGGLVSKKLRTPLHDVDTIIEYETGTRVSTILDALGDERFLMAESDLVRRVFRRYIDGVLSLSGSVPLVDATMEHLSRLGTFVYLDTPVTEIEKRRGSMLTDRIVGRYDENGRERTFEEVYHIRHTQYEKWAARGITVKTEGKSNEEIVEEVLLSTLNFS